MKVNQSTYRVRKGTVQDKVAIQLVTSRAAGTYQILGKGIGSKVQPEQLLTKLK